MFVVYQNARKHDELTGTRRRAAAANHAAVPSPHASHIHFDWFYDAGNIFGAENR
jgi:hypothetical protein